MLHDKIQGELSANHGILTKLPNLSSPQSIYLLNVNNWVNPITC